MLVLTVQKYSVLRQVYSKEGYTPSFWKSTNAFLSPLYTKGYKIVLEELFWKTNAAFNFGEDSCIWGWVSNPFLGYYNNRVFDGQDDALYAVIVDVSEDDMVFTDYDKYVEYIEGESGDEGFFIDDAHAFGSKCVQCSFLNITPSNIEGIAGLDCLVGCSDDMSSVAQRVYKEDISYTFMNTLIRKRVLYYPHTNVFDRLAFNM